MAKYTFTATHGVEFGEHAPAGKDGSGGAYEVWAKFVRDPSLDTADGQKTFTFGTDDLKVAKRLREVSDYGMAESKDAEPDAESDAD
jgi:hypothetical protein